MRFFGGRWTLKEAMSSPYGVVGAAVVASAGYYAWTRHQVHVLAALPYVLVGGCMLMHVFMLRGHGHSPGASADDQGSDDERRR